MDVIIESRKLRGRISSFQNLNEAERYMVVCAFLIAIYFWTYINETERSVLKV